VIENLAQVANLAPRFRLLGVAESRPDAPGLPALPPRGHFPDGSQIRYKRAWFA
jgi:hypothetical protein